MQVMSRQPSQTQPALRHLLQSGTRAARTAQLLQQQQHRRLFLHQWMLIRCGTHMGLQHVAAGRVALIPIQMTCRPEHKGILLHSLLLKVKSL